MPGDAHLRGPRLSATLAALGDAELGLAWLSEQDFGAVQLSAAQPGLRPRELDAGARRGLRERLRRLELEPSGIDLWIPLEHFEGAATMPRAVDAMHAAIGLAEFLGRIPVSGPMPRSELATEARVSILAEAERRGVTLVDFAVGAVPEGPVRVGFDLVTCLEQGARPIEAIARAGASLGAVRIGAIGTDAGRRPIVPGSAAAEELALLRTALELGGFRGIPIADARAWPDPHRGLIETLAAWRSTTSAAETP